MPEDAPQEPRAPWTADTDEVLLVEDAAEVALLAGKLGKGQYLVHWCQTAEEALHQLQEARPNLILIDIRLPGMSGLDLCRELCRRDASSPTQARPLRAVFSHWDRPNEVRDALDAGADCLVTKDLLRQPAAWQARIQELLRAGSGGQVPPVSISSSKLPPPLHSPATISRPMWLLLEKAWSDVAVRRLGPEVAQILLRRAAGQAKLPAPVPGPWRMETEAPESFALLAASLAEGLWRLLGQEAAVIFLDRLQQAGEPHEDA